MAVSLNAALIDVLIAKLIEQAHAEDEALANLDNEMDCDPPGFGNALED